MRNHLSKKVIYFLLLALSSFSIIQADVIKSESEALTDVEVVNAVWQEQEARIFYTSFNVYYSCSSIEDSVERLLEELGAKDVKARAGACGINDIERSIPIRVQFKTLSSNTEVDGSNESNVNARYAEVDFKQIYRRRSFRDGASNCDLVRAVSKSVSNLFELEILNKQRLCNSGYTSSNDVTWKVNVLKPIN